MHVKDWIDLVGAIGSILVAAGTGYLAWTTSCLAKLTQTTVADTKEGFEQADRHHQENLRPFCVIEFEDSDTAFPFGKYFAPTGKKNISINGLLMNKGLGPAKDVVVYLNFGGGVDGDSGYNEDNVCWLTYPVTVCGIIGKNESIEIKIHILDQNIISKYVDGEWRPNHNLDGVATDAYEVVLRYRDIFDNVYRTVHAKGFPQNIQNAIAAIHGDKLVEPQQSIRPSRPMPVFLKGHQAWRTLTDRNQLGV